MRCDVLAKGLVEAAREIKINVPLVIRLAGTNYKEGKKIGEIKKAIEEAILDGKIDNDHDNALAYLYQIKDDYIS